MEVPLLYVPRNKHAVFYIPFPIIRFFGRLITTFNNLNKDQLQIAHITHHKLTLAIYRVKKTKRKIIHNKSSVRGDDVFLSSTGQKTIPLK